MISQGRFGKHEGESKIKDAYSRRGAYWVRGFGEGELVLFLFLPTSISGKVGILFFVFSSIINKRVIPSFPPRTHTHTHTPGMARKFVFSVYLLSRFRNYSMQPN